MDDLEKENLELCNLLFCRLRQVNEAAANEKVRKYFSNPRLKYYSLKYWGIFWFVSAFIAFTTIKVIWRFPFAVNIAIALYVMNCVILCSLVTMLVDFLLCLWRSWREEHDVNAEAKRACEDIKIIREIKKYSSETRIYWLKEIAAREQALQKRREGLLGTFVSYLSLQLCAKFIASCGFLNLKGQLDLVLILINAVLIIMCSFVCYFTLRPLNNLRRAKRFLEVAQGVIQEEWQVKSHTPQAG